MTLPVQRNGEGGTRLNAVFGDRTVALSATRLFRHPEAVSIIRSENLTDRTIHAKLHDQLTTWRSNSDAMPPPEEHLVRSRRLPNSPHVDEETNDFIVPGPCRFQQWRVAGIVFPPHIRENRSISLRLRITASLLPSRHERRPRIGPSCRSLPKLKVVMTMARTKAALPAQTIDIRVRRFMVSGIEFVGDCRPQDFEGASERILFIPARCWQCPK